MGNETATLNEKNVAAALAKQNENFDVGTSGFLPRLQFCSSSCQQCKDGDIKANHFALIQGTEILADFGETLEGIHILTNRGKAVDSRKEDTVIIYGDKKKEAYAAIAALDIGEDIKHGPESLVYIPGHEFATFFWGANKSLALTASTRLSGVTGSTVDLSHKPAQSKNGKFKWRAVKVIKSDTQLELGEDIPLDKLASVMNDFNNAQDKLPEDTTGDDDR